MTKGIIFDMDGTMVDNMMIHHRAWQRKLAELGLDFTLQEVVEQIHGVNDEILVRLFGDRFTAAERQQIAAEKEAAYREIFLPELKLIDGLPQFLDQLQQAGVPLVIGTAAPVENMDFILDELHLRPYFRAAFHAGDVSQGKPHPEIFQKAAAALGLAASDCLVFEDSPTGIETARRAGSQAVAITSSHTAAEFAHFPHVLGCVPDYRGLAWEEGKLVL
ncbi:MAG: beta-phosphoglucomutase [Bacteroidetes bacterium]|nr:MAG: beta-phosphoglucomutase [Bacteroidota bacterium]